jgi:hypothetical protein
MVAVGEKPPERKREREKTEPQGNETKRSLRKKERQ